MKSLDALFARPEAPREPQSPEETAQALIAAMAKAAAVDRTTRNMSRPGEAFERARGSMTSREAPLDAAGALRQDEALTQLRTGESARLERLRRLFGNE